MISKQKILELFDEYPSHLAHKIKGNYTESYQFIQENFEGGTFTEKIYQYVYGKEEKVCDLDGCENICNFQRFGSGFKNYCSYECNGKSKENKVKNQCEICEKEFVTVKSRSRRFCSHDCRVEYQNTKEWSDKMVESYRKTMRDEYGEDYYFQTEEFQRKSKKTRKKRYDDPNYVNFEKAKKTKKERYGNPNYNNMNKYLETINEKYTSKNGTKIENISQTVEYKNKLNKNQLNVIDQKLPNHIDRKFDGENYIGVVNGKGSIKYQFQCEKCGLKFSDHLNNGRIPFCPNCDKSFNGTSEKEFEVFEFVRSFVPDRFDIVKNDRSVLNNKELDIYIPEKNIAVEFDGLYWHSEKSGEKTKDYHLNKTEECEERGIQLIHIFENEWLFKRGIVENRLKYVLDESNENSIYARNCEVKRIENDKKREFLNQYHLNGSGRSRVKLGLSCEDKLIGVMTFGRPSVAQGHQNNDFWEIKRFALSDQVVGGASKLFSNFVETWNPDKVLTYADRRWSIKWNNVYEKIGFEFKGYSDSNYYYFKKEDFQLYHRFNFRKDVLNEKLNEFDSDLTEWENMQVNGYDRIWDCGHLKYIWNKSKKHV